MSTSTDVSDWITAIASVISALSIVFVGIQTKLLLKQIRSDHERSRRERAVEIIREWSNGIQRESSAARKFVETLDEMQIKALVNIKPFAVERNAELFLKACVGDEHKGVKFEENKISLDTGAVSLVRWYVMRYLNGLECVMVAWRHNAADQEIIKEEFSYLFKQIPGDLVNLRKECDSLHSFPALEEFIETYRDKRGPGKGILK